MRRPSVVLRAAVVVARVGALVLAALVLGLSSIAVGAAAPGVDPAAVDRYMSAYLSKSGLPGAAVAITHGTRVVHVAGYGHDSTGAAVTATTRMPIASLSKSMTALALMQLVDAGTVELDAPVPRYLPDFRTADPRGERITVRQLLNQTSGMSDTAFPDLRLPQADSLTGAVERLHSADLASDPGTEFHYHNPNYQVVARIVEVVSGEPYADYLRRQVFSPLGMNDSTTVDTAQDAKELPRGHIRAYGTAFAVGEPEWFVGGSHGVLSTAGDLARWLIAQNNDGTAPDGRRVVSTAAMTAMHTPSSVSDYGMGWWQQRSDEGSMRLEHNGDWFTYTAEQLLLPESGYGIAVLANTGMAIEDDPGIIADGLAELVAGRSPDVRRPAGIYTDWALAVLTLGTIVLGVRGVLRARTWAARHADGRMSVRIPWLRVYRSPSDPGVRWLVLRLSILLIPLALLLFLPWLAGLVFAGRAGGHLHVFYVMPALVLWLVTAAVLAIAVLTARTVRLVAARRARP
ncbi:serine hydrolase domain-containing protein [Nocardia huaxiensis]|uniref:serine hydrolase domain-containing protein n=1 Tax=Nocardia huaxiensis TaxID=2755382 RepID=UPI001C662FA2|nr:serine hydrolase domain-containing protein [Nocardia huaxiensis]